MPNQFVCEYSGPRLPARLQRTGSYVLGIPNTSYVIDGASENSPFACPRSPAIFANHSYAPNAHLELWPTPRPGAMELRQRMVIVANEVIGAGREIRINYESEAHTFWRGDAPAETPWRNDFAPPPGAGGRQAAVYRV